MRMSPHRTAPTAESETGPGTSPAAAHETEAKIAPGQEEEMEPGSGDAGGDASGGRPVKGAPDGDIVADARASTLASGQAPTPPAGSGAAESGAPGPSGPSAGPDPYHYALIARALDAIDRDRALSLEELSGRLGLSPAHFQRTFSAWVGVSPKRYQQYLTLDHARRLLAERFTLLEAADEAGLSGPSRLHDLFLRWEAMSPGDYARRGAGLEIRHAHAPSPFGEVLAMATDRGICGLAFTDGVGRAAAMADMTARWPAATFRPDPAVADSIANLFGGGAGTRLHLIGAPFQIKVWEALLRIPSGHVTSYSEIATAIGHPRATRAVGTAVGRNPVSWLIPCHRAITRDGRLGGYHWGLPVKRAMLAWEAARADAA